VALLISGSANVLAVTFPLREDAAGVTYDLGGQQVAGMIFFASSCIALIARSRRCAADPRCRSRAGWVMLAGVLTAMRSC